MNVKGLSIQQIMNIDLDTFNSLKESDLRHITSRLVSAGNKRIRRLEKLDINSPAYQSLGDNKRFSTKLDANTSVTQRVNRLRQEFARVRSFLTLKTSTARGYQTFKKETFKRLSRELNMSEKTIKTNLDIDRLFRLHKEMKKTGVIPSYRGSEGSEQARNMIAEILVRNPKISDEELKEYFENAFNDWYEQKQKESDNIENETEESDL